jgi:hypothetical protein
MTPPVPRSHPDLPEPAQVPYLVPLPPKHTLAVKRPDLLVAEAFGNLREDNLQLVLQVRCAQRTVDA